MTSTMVQTRSAQAGRRLPIAAIPVPGESFESWTLRTAHLLRTPPGMLLETLGVPMRANSSATPSFFGVTLTDQVRSNVLSATRMKPTALDAMLLTAYGGGAVDLSVVDVGSELTLRGLGRKQWLKLWGSRACGECLTDGVWRLEWKLLTTGLCTRHRRVLFDSCPGCGHILRRGAFGRPMVLSRRRQLAPTACGHLVGDKGCPVDLRDHVGVAMGTGHQAQEMLLEAANGAAQSVAGSIMEPEQLYATVRALSALVRFSSAPELLAGPVPDVVRAEFELFVAGRSGRSGGSADGYHDGPPTASAAAGLLHVIEPALTARTYDEQADALGGLFQAVRRRRRALGRLPVDATALGPSLLVALMREPHTNLAASWAKGARAVPRCLPELAPALEWRAHFASVVPGTFEITGRRFVALAVARALGARSWPDAGELIGCGRLVGIRTADVVARRVTDNSEFADLVAELAVQLLADGVDYPTRRHNLQDLTVVDHSTLPETVRVSLAPWTVTRRRCVAAWVWGEAGGGDWRTSPAMGDTSWRASPESRRELYRQFARRLGPGVLEVLSEWAVTLAERKETS